MCARLLRPPCLNPSPNPFSAKARHLLAPSPCLMSTLVVGHRDSAGIVHHRPPLLRGSATRVDGLPRCVPSPLSWFRSTSLVRRSSCHRALGTSLVDVRPRRCRAATTAGEPPHPLSWSFGVKWDARSCRAVAPSTREALRELKLAGRPSLASHRPRRALCRARAPRACAEPRCSGCPPWPHVVGWPGCFGPRHARPPGHCAAGSQFMLAGPAGRSHLCGLGH
jgi:hypothetical protein